MDSKLGFAFFRAQLMTFQKCVGRMIKYQVATKLLLSIVLIPIFGLVLNGVLDTTGVKAISNSNMMRYFFTPQGLVLLGLGVFFVLVLFLVELGGFIKLSAQVYHNQPESSYLDILMDNFKSLPKFFEIGGLLIVLYLVVLIPLGGNGMTLSFFEKFKIPNFIMSVVDNTPLYAGISALVGIFIFIISLLWLFTFHFIVLGKQNPSSALKSSTRLVLKNKGKLIKHAVIYLSLSLILFGLLGFIWLIGVGLLSTYLNFNVLWPRIFMTALLILQEMGIFFIVMLAIPYEVHHFTCLYYTLTANDEDFYAYSKLVPEVRAKQKASLLDRLLSRRKTLLALSLIVIASLSTLIGYFINDIAMTNSHIQVMSHRAGGFGAPENSIEGVQYAIDQGAQWIEIDVQRTKDGYYILNHDDDFKRLANEPRRVGELTLKEIQSLHITNDKGQSVNVPTIDQVLEVCKGKIGMNIELKGESADYKMVEDLVLKIRAAGMRKQVILTSLKYELIQYIESKYPVFDSGFIYFLSLGDIASYTADYLIIEEDIATDANIAKIHEQGKKVVVWTVNTKESMEHFTESDVDAIITDDLITLQSVQKENEDQNLNHYFLKMFMRLQ